MPKSKIFLIIALSLTLASISLGDERIECRWSAEYLCGDKCTKIANTCFCGNGTITFDDAKEFNCCNKRECVKDDVINTGHVHCPDGSIQKWQDPCNGRCKQYAAYGHTTISCEDQAQCVKELILCRGIPMCNE